MRELLPLALVSDERREVLEDAMCAAADVLARVFPPRDDDDAGVLALTAVEMFANEALRHNVDARCDPQERRWWLEGFWLGFVATTVEVLSAAQEYADLDVTSRLVDMEAFINDRLDGAAATAAQVTFALARAAANDDEVALALQLETLWNPESGWLRTLDAQRISGTEIDTQEPGEVTAYKLANWYKLLLTASVNIACASWQLLLVLQDDPN